MIQRLNDGNIFTQNSTAFIYLFTNVFFGRSTRLLLRDRSNAEVFNVRLMRRDSPVLSAFSFCTPDINYCFKRRVSRARCVNFIVRLINRAT